MKEDERAKIRKIDLRESEILDFFLIKDFTVFDAFIFR